MKKKSESGQIPLGGGDEGEILARLSERVERAIAVIQDLRRERDALRAQVRGQETLEEDCERFRKERDEIRNRIESILSSLEALEE